MSKFIPSPDPRPLAERLAAYGCTDLIPLDAKLTSPEQLDYLDLLPTKTNQSSNLAAVAAHQGTALLYIVDASKAAGSHPAALAQVSRQLANRSDPAWLGVLQPGSPEIFPIGFHDTLRLKPVMPCPASQRSDPN